jgi:isopentenyldiphosphate isomerase
MGQEYFDIYNEKMEHIGTELRSTVHKKGYWHKSFQCWFVYVDNGKQFILFQLRHADKDTYPNLLDITSAGHLSAGEKVEDGIRELEEELGIKVEFQQLMPIGIFTERKSEDYFIDNEYGHVFLYNCRIPMDQFKLQLEELTGMFKVELNELLDLFTAKVETVKIDGYEINNMGERSFISRNVSIKDFVPHDAAYYTKVIDEAKKYLSGIKLSTQK